MDLDSFDLIEKNDDGRCGIKYCVKLNFSVLGPNNLRNLRDFAYPNFGASACLFIIALDANELDDIKMATCKPAISFFIIVPLHDV